MCYTTLVAGASYQPYAEAMHLPVIPGSERNDQYVRWLECFVAMRCYNVAHVPIPTPAFQAPRNFSATILHSRNQAIGWHWMLCPILERTRIGKLSAGLRAPRSVTQLPSRYTDATKPASLLPRSLSSMAMKMPCSSTS